MRSFAVAAVLLALATAALAQTNDDVTALTGLQKCVQNSKGGAGYIAGWGGGSTTAAAGRKLLQTQQNCEDAAKVGAPCTVTATPGGTTTPSAAVPPTPGSPAGTSTTPTGIPTGTSSNPCGDSSNPVPWTGLLCTNGRVTSVLLSQLGPNFFKGTCDVGNLTDLAGLSAAVNVDFTASGLSGTVPAAWGTGAWAGTLQSLVLAQNPNITGAIPDLSGLTKLQSLQLSNSSFSGSIPASFNSTTFPSLLSFTAFANKLTGPLPASLPANLTTLGVGLNQLNGTLPAYNSSTLGTLQVNGNLLTGCLPSSWPSTLTNITNLDLSNNQLSGPIPQTWQARGAFPTLQIINIAGNKLCGSTGELGTPVAPVGQNNPNASRLVPSVTLDQCSGSDCVFAAGPAISRLSIDPFTLAPAPSPFGSSALSPFTALPAATAPGILPVLPAAGRR